MGMKFANLQVRDLSLAESEKFLPDAIANQFSSRWTTIVQDDFDIGSIDMVGRKLSKKVDKTVLSVAYFDDDILVLTLFKNGKSIACHSSSNGYGHAKKMGNPLVFAQEFELDDTSRDYLKWIFKCEDLPKKVDLLEKLLGIPLWIDAEMLEEDGVEDFNGNRELSSVAQYVYDKKTSEKIKNRTKPKLISEFEGEFGPSFTSRCFLINQPNDDNEYLLKNYEIFTPLPDGSLATIFGDASAYLGIDSRILANKNLIAAFEHPNLLSTFDTSGNLLANQEYSEYVGYPLLMLPNGSVIFSTNGSKQIISLYTIDGKKLWEFHVKRICVDPIFYNNSIYFHYEIMDEDKSEILKISQRGEIEARFELMPCGGCHWYTFLFDKDGYMYYFCTVNRESKSQSILFCFDEQLQKIAEIEFDDVSFDGIIDNEQNKIYILFFRKELAIVDIGSFQVCTQKKYDECDKLCMIDSHGGIVTEKYSSTIEIFDEDLNIISRHRLKGAICSYYKNSKDNVCFVTSDSADHDNTKKSKSTIRVYEIVYS